MKRKVLLAASLFSAFTYATSADDRPMQSTGSSGLKSGHVTVQAVVLKSFAADDEGARFRAYLVNWKGAPVIVSDVLGTTDKKEGDTISFMVQRLHLPRGTNTIATLQFMIVDTGELTKSRAEFARKNLSAEEELSDAKSEEERFDALGSAAKEMFNSGKYSEAKRYAEELASMATRYRGDWNYGNAIQDANVVLGRLAVRDGDIAAARAFLIEAGKSPGSPQMNSFGPNLSLANDLLQAGEKDAVIDYLNACKHFWKMDFGKLDDWIALVRAGRLPDFGANLIY